MKVYLGILITLVSCAVYSAEVAAPQANVELYNNYIEQHPEGFSSIDLSADIPRTTLELLILQRALKLGGLDEQLKFSPLITEGRIMADLIQGVSLIGGPIWRPEIGEGLYASEPIIRKGELAALVYKHESNLRLTAVDSYSDLRPFVAARVMHWKDVENDFRTMKIKSVVALDETAVFKLLRAGRADFVFFFPSSEPDLSLTRNGITLVPVEGVKSPQQSSSHFVISKAHPDGEATLKALNAGLKVMREKGEITRVFEAMGVFRKEIKDWANIIRD